MSLIVADTTPVSCVVRIGRADLLTTLFPDVRIPTAVADELDRGLGIVGDWRSALRPGFRIETVDPSPLLGLLQDELDAGEAKRRGLIPEARPIIAQVRTRGGLWLSDKLVADVLAQLGE